MIKINIATIESNTVSGIEHKTKSFPNQDQPICRTILKYFITFCS
jgi:hypothetical protein